MYYNVTSLINIVNMTIPQLMIQFLKVPNNLSLQPIY